MLFLEVVLHLEQQRELRVLALNLSFVVVQQLIKYHVLPSISNRIYFQVVQKSLRYAVALVEQQRKRAYQLKNNLVVDYRSKQLPRHREVWC
jgi:hypothetical protein